MKYILIFLLIIRPWPDPRFYTDLYQIYDAITYVFIIICFIYVVIKYNFKTPNFITWHTFFAVLFISSIAISLIINANKQGFSDYAELVKWGVFLVLLWLLILLQIREESDLSTVLYYLAIFQVPVQIIQLIFPDLFLNISFLYSSHKLEVDYIRAPGLMGNPNHLAMLYFSVFLISLYHFKGVIQFGSILLLLLGIAFTGSVAFMVIASGWLVLYLFRSVWLFSNKIYVFLVSFVLILLLAVSLIFIFKNLEYFPRFERLLEFDISDPLSFHNIQTRFSVWERVTGAYFNSLDFVHVLFGFGPSKQYGLEYVDNEHLFIFLRYGLFGYLSYIAFIASIYIGVNGVYSKPLRSFIFCMLPLTLFLEIFYLNKAIAIMFILLSSLYAKKRKPV